MNYSYTAGIDFILSIRLSQDARYGTICPRDNSPYTKQQWDALSDDDREYWVKKAAQQWAESLTKLTWVKKRTEISSVLMQNFT